MCTSLRYECSQKRALTPHTPAATPIDIVAAARQPAFEAVGRLYQDTTDCCAATTEIYPPHEFPKHHHSQCLPGTRTSGGLWPGCHFVGLVLDDDPKPVKAAACEKTGENQLSLTLTEGKYHQVKRMIAAVGNRVEDVGGLHRSRIGALDLPADLLPGQWRWLTAEDLSAISA